MKQIANINNKLAFNISDYGLIYPTFRILEDIPDFLKLYLSCPIFLSCKVLHIFIKVEVPDYIVTTDNYNEKITYYDDEAIQLHSSVVKDLLENRLYDFALSMNLSIDLDISFEEGVIIDDYAFAHKTRKINSNAIHEAKLHSSKTDWPKFKKVELISTWDWLQKQQGFINGLGKDATERALSAITKIITCQDSGSPECLFWALIGIESIYTSGKSGLLEQVRDKSQILLGKQEAYKKSLSKMYEFRSRFVHGDLNFPVYNNILDGQEIEKYYNELDNALNVAISVLVCTIQELIIRNWKTIEFQYAVSGINEKD